MLLSESCHGELRRRASPLLELLLRQGRLSDAHLHRLWLTLAALSNRQATPTQEYVLLEQSFLMLLPRLQPQQLQFLWACMTSSTQPSPSSSSSSSSSSAASSTSSPATLNQSWAAATSASASAATTTMTAPVVKSEPKSHSADYLVSLAIATSSASGSSSSSSGSQGSKGANGVDARRLQLMYKFACVALDVEHKTVREESKRTWYEFEIEILLFFVTHLYLFDVSKFYCRIPSFHYSSPNINNICFCFEL